MATAIFLEGLQLLVYSRVSDITDILTAMIGAGIGVWLSRYWRAKNREPERADGHTAQWLGMAQDQRYWTYLIGLAVFGLLWLLQRPRMPRPESARAPA